MARRPITLDAESVQLTYSLYVVLAYEYFESCDLFERLLMVNCHHQTPAQVTCAHCQRSSEPASAPRPFPSAPKCPREPHIIQAFRRTSTPDDEKFGRFRTRKRGSIQRFESGHLVRRFEPLRRFTDDPVAGPRIMHIRMTCRYTSAKIFFVMA